MSKYKLAICEKYNKNLHGNLNIDKDLNIATYLIDLPDFYNNDYLTIMSIIREGYLNVNMINYIKNIKFEIVEIYYLNRIMLCNFKTKLIEKIQKLWKKKYNKKKEFITKCKSIKYIRYRELYGKFPKN